MRFKEIFEELDALLEKKAMDELDPPIVNGLRAQVGVQSKYISPKAKGDASLKFPRKDGDTLTNSKELDYPSDRVTKKNSKKIDLSMIGDKDLGMEDEPKKAAYKAKALLDSIDKLINDHLDKKAEATLQQQVDQLALQKAAAYEEGRKAFHNWKNYIDKFAADADPSAPKNSPQYQGDLADTAVASLIDKTDPHNVSDNKAPEAKPGSSGSVEAKPLQKGKDHVEDELEAKASLMIMKANLYDNLCKAAAANDPLAVAKAKADIYDFIRNYGV